MGVYSNESCRKDKVFFKRISRKDKEFWGKMPFFLVIFCLFWDGFPHRPHPPNLLNSNLLFSAKSNGDMFVRLLFIHWKKTEGDLNMGK